MMLLKQNGQPFMTARKLIDIAGARGMIRTCDPLIRSAITSTALSYGSYDLLTLLQVASASESIFTTYSDQFRCGVVTSLSQSYGVNPSVEISFRLGPASTLLSIAK
jgi:hypothetical protein